MEMRAPVINSSFVFSVQILLGISCPLIQYPTAPSPPKLFLLWPLERFSQAKQNKKQTNKQIHIIFSHLFKNNLFPK